ncbi:MAG TPA: SPOR domain-containing protein [Bacteroidales bacterium]|nr:SPOR domain-containing protein [Bacteroidales bacterium]HRZ48582.1 SPOR domain-containing protein [Bacteroidales bacterium]
MEITRYIAEMLFLRESVILPGFGELKTSVKNPGILAEGSLTPPGKSVSFNPSVKANDYVLARFIAEKEGISISQGNEKLRNLVVEMMETLEKNGDFTLAGIGSFSLDERNSLSFMADPEANFDLSTYGLGRINPIEPAGQPGSVSSKTVTDKESPETPAGSEPLSEEIPVARQRKRRWIWVSIVAILIAGAGTIGYLYPDYFTSAWSHISEKLNLNQNTPATETQPAPADIPASKPQEMESPADSTDAISPDSVEPASDAGVQAQAVQPAGTGDFMIVAGCFGKEANAEKLVNQLRDKGFANAAIEGKTSSGLFRVSAGSFATREDAEKSLQEAHARNELKNAWVGKK